MSDPSVMEDEYHNKTIDMQIAEVEAKLKKEKISKEEYNEEVERLKSQKIEIKLLSLGSESKPWPETVEFYILEKEEWRRSTLDLELLYHSPTEPELSFTGNLVAYAEYGLEPEKADNIQEGVHQIKAVTPIAESNLIVIRIVQKDDRKPSEQKLRSIAEYHIKKKRYKDAFKASSRILKKNPHSISALILMSDYHTSRKEYDKALELLEKAKKEYGTRHPDWYEPPSYIQKKITRIELLKDKES